MSIVALRWITVLGACVLFTPASLPAQADEQAAEVRHRNNCRLAAQVLRTGNPRTRYDWARNLISSCRDEGPAFFVEQWRTIHPDTAESELFALVRHSARVRDARLYAELRSVAADRARPDVVRVGAMLVLIRYVTPSHVIWFRDVALPPEPIRGIRTPFGSSTGWVQYPGAEPIVGSIASEVLALFETIAEEEEARNRSMWYAAAALARLVRSDIHLGQAQ